MSTMTTFSHVDRFTVEICIECGVAFGISSEFREQLLRSGKFFNCPNGHRQAYTETTEQKLRKQLADKELENQRLSTRIAQERSMRESAELSASVARGQVTKLRKRVGAGVCPCCKRTFKQLANHMKCKHPEYVEK